MKSLKREMTSTYLHFRKVTGYHVEMKFKEDKRISGKITSRVLE